MGAVTRVLDDAGIAYEIVEHPAVYTVDDVLLHMPEKYPVKNLLLKEEKGNRCVFVIMKGDERLDTKLVQKELQTKKLQFAKPDILKQKLGVEPGSASLFCLLHNGSLDVEVVIDSRLAMQKTLGFHPSENTKTIFIRGSELALFLQHIKRGYTELRMSD